MLMLGRQKLKLKLKLKHPKTANMLNENNNNNTNNNNDNHCYAMAKSITTTTATITTIHTRKGNTTTTITFVLLLILCCLCDYNYGSWASQCWKKHNSGSIQTPDGEFKRPFGILCTYRCFLWFPPIYPYCEFIFDLRLSRHFTSFPDCYEIRCNETFSFFGSEQKNY